MNKYPRSYHAPNSLGTTSDDKISKDISNLIGIRLIVTEKLDGSNFCWKTYNGDKNTYARSHAAPTKNPWDEKLRHLHYNIKHLLEDDVIIFGENMEAIHSIEYDNLESFVYLFNVVQNEMFLSWEYVELWANILGLPTVPVLFDGVVNSESELLELVERLSNEPSKVGGFDVITGNKMKEGVVARTYDEFPVDMFSKMLIKWVRKGHVSTNKHWTKSWRKATLPTTRYMK